MENEEVIEQEDDPNDICPACNGSGEGQYDGTRCSSCKGRGVIKYIGEES